MSNKDCNNNINATSSATTNTNDRNFIDFSRFENFGLLETISSRTITDDIAKSAHKNSSNQ